MVISQKPEAQSSQVTHPKPHVATVLTLSAASPLIDLSSNTQAAWTLLHLKHLWRT